MKIAAITDDGETISQHFGRAPYYLVVTVEEGKITDREMRDKLGHAHFANEPHEPDRPDQPHGFGFAAHDRHTRMAQSVADYEAVLCRGMGAGAYNSMQKLGIKPVLTDIASIDDAVNANIEGSIVDHVDKLH
jgi:predicted Fe-Mo cluster-binding NifX family protein